MPEDWKEWITRRRVFLIAPAAFAGLIAASSRKGSDGKPAKNLDQEVTIVDFDDSGKKIGPEKVHLVIHTDAEWKSMLTREQFYVTRKANTDSPFSGTYYKLHQQGMFRCICCGNALFSSDTKFDSGTGWPSFYEPIAKENIATHHDTSMFMERVEVLCTKCEAHLGHVFDDGPPPTGLRYCINESSLRFVPRPKS